jgi:hypothetical protein
LYWLGIYERHAIHHKTWVVWMFDKDYLVLVWNGLEYLYRWVTSSEDGGSLVLPTLMHLSIVVNRLCSSPAG